MTTAQEIQQRALVIDGQSNYGDDRDIEAYLGGNIARAFGEIWRP